MNISMRFCAIPNVKKNCHNASRHVLASEKITLDIYNNSN